jgi:hypothetical protein
VGQAVDAVKGVGARKSSTQEGRPCLGSTEVTVPLEELLEIAEPTEDAAAPETDESSLAVVFAVASSLFLEQLIATKLDRIRDKTK